MSRATFIPHGATCEADHANGPDWGKCGEPARAVIFAKDRDRYVCGRHLKLWIEQGCKEPNDGIN